MGCRIYIVEDHVLMRDVLSEFIEGVPALDLCGAATTAEEALERMGQANPDLALIDVSLPRMSGIDLVRELHQRQPELPCVMLSGHQEVTYVERALEAGARGYVLKGDPFEIPRAIQCVLNGGTYLSGTMRGKIWGQPDPEEEEVTG